MEKQELIDFEKEIVELFNEGKLRSPVHLSGGNEDEVIEIFKKLNQQIGYSLHIEDIIMRYFME